MDASIASILTLDGVTNGAIYALLALAMVLVFAVTRVIFIPQGEFVAYGALTLAMLQLGKVPGTVWLLLVLARWSRRCSMLVDGAARAACRPRRWRRPRCATLPCPAIVVALALLGRAAQLAAAARRALLDAGHRHAARAAGLPPGLPVAGRRDACWCC